MSNQPPQGTHHRAIALVLTAVVAIGLARLASRPVHAAIAAVPPADAASDGSAIPVPRRGPHVLDPNVATAYELETLPAVGPALAARIVAARTRPFRRPEDLLRVRGIGPHTLERLRPLLRFASADAATARDPGSTADR